MRYPFFLRRKWIICTYRYVVRNDAFLRKLSKMIGFSRFKDQEKWLRLLISEIHNAQVQPPRVTSQAGLLTQLESQGTSG